MTLEKLFPTIRPYVRIAFGLIIVGVIASQAEWFFSLFEKSADHELLTIFFEITVICGLSFIIHYLSLGTFLPSFVLAIFFGQTAQPLLAPLVHNEAGLAALVGFGATLILFGGGLETPFVDFRRLFWKINILSFPGLLLTAVAFSFSVMWAGQLFGTPISIVVAVLLGAALASTDPAAIIPVLKQLRFKNRATKDIVVAESAMTDVTGSLLTIVFLSILAGGATFASVGDGYRQLFSMTTAMVLLKEIGFGVMFGILGYGMLHVLRKVKKYTLQEYGVDSAFFIFVPVMAFTGSLAFGGSGYLAAFVAGLLFSITEHLHETETFFNNTVDGFLKPMIFVLLGALVDAESLIAYMGIGLVAAAVFMFVIRPIVVFLCLSPFFVAGKDRLTWREAVFISFVRETGAIPAVLLVTIVSLGLGNLDGLVAIGMWVILATLIVEPPLTPLIAKHLNIATPITDADALDLNGDGDPYVILGSRGRSFLPRLPKVVDWVSLRHIRRVIVLLCLEDRYTPEFLEEIKTLAADEFKKMNQAREDEGKLPLQFELVSRSGFLQNNIEYLAGKQEGITAIFVGKKMLDYRLTDIKHMSVPFFFLD